MRHIDADALVDFISCGNTYLTPESVVEIINNAPTCDEIVHCKDCCHLSDDLRCYQLGIPIYTIIQDRMFCACGVRK